jgi:hypothetical protein
MHALEISQSGVHVILDQKIPGLISCQSFNGYSIPFADNSFELAILSHVIEHVEFERALLREVLRVSRYQVIEIPTDFPALSTDNFQMLGPSYGHINAYAPQSFRFLLSTEGFRILHDMLGRYDLTVQEYTHFVKNNRPKTPDTVRRFRESFEQQERAFERLPLAEKQLKASYYAVLTKREAPSEKLMRALSAAKAYIDAGQLEPARLVFKHHVPKDQAVGAALEIAQHCREGNHIQAGREFADLALAADPSNSAATRIKIELQAMADQSPSVPKSSGLSFDMRSHPVFKRWLKKNLGGAIDLVRTLRK